MAKKNGKGKSPAKTPVKVPQPHGGAILQGGNPGNRGGSGGGRPPSVLRQRLRDSADDRMKVLEEVADGEDPNAKPSDRIKAVDILLKYGLGEEKGWAHELVAELVRDLADAIERHVHDRDTLKAIEGEFRSAIGRHKPH